STFRLRSLRLSAENLACWLRTQSLASNQHSSCPIVACASPKTPVVPARTSGFVSAVKTSSIARSFESRERNKLVGLTNLITRNAPMSPKLNRRRAQFVLTQVDQILDWENRKEAEKDTRFVELGRYLCEVRQGQYWRLEKLESFDEFLEK